MDKVYLNAKLHMLLMAILIIGGINWGAHAMGYNLVDHFSMWLNKVMNTNIHFNNIIYYVVAIVAVIIAMKRSTWLPFLGQNVFPTSLVPIASPKNIKTDTSVTVQVSPNTKVAYWASLPGDGKKVDEAYADFSNSGVVMSNEKGEAVLNIIKGGNYIVPSGRKIERHIHYREIGLPYGMIGKIKTVYY
jgi:hypothetical protein